MAFDALTMWGVLEWLRNVALIVIGSGIFFMGFLALQRLLGLT